MIKMVFCLRKRPDMSTDDFYDYWLNSHGALVSAFAKTLNVRRYVQSPTKAPEVSEALCAARGMKQPYYEGIAEFWWDSLEAMQTAFESEQGQKISKVLAEDELKFIDMESSAMFFTEEHELISLAK